MLLFENDRNPVSEDFKYIGVGLSQEPGDSEASTCGSLATHQGWAPLSRSWRVALDPHRIHGRVRALGRET